MNEEPPDGWPEPYDLEREATDEWIDANAPQEQGRRITTVVLGFGRSLDVEQGDVLLVVDGRAVEPGDVEAVLSSLT